MYAEKGGEKYFNTRDKTECEERAVLVRWASWVSAQEMLKTERSRKDKRSLLKYLHICDCSGYHTGYHHRMILLCPGNGQWRKVGWGRSRARTA